MSTETPDFQDRSLARRFNFLGLPGEKRAGMSYAALRAELGDDNAAALVTKIGTLLQSQGLDRLGVPLHDAVDRIVQSLTPDERRTIAEGGGLPPRVQTQIGAEVAAAKVQQGQASANVHASGHGPDNAALRGFGTGVVAGGTGLANRDASGSRSDASASYSGSVSSVTAENYSFTPFATSGLSYATFSYLRGQGFDETNIIHAAQDAKQTGFDPNDQKIAKSFAVLDKDDGKRREERNRLLERMDERLQHDETFQNLKAQREQAQTDADRSRIDRQLNQRGQEISKEVGFNKHIQAAPTTRAREAGRLIEHEKIQQRAHDHISQLAPGDEAEAKRLATTLDQARRTDDPRIIDKTLDKYAETNVDDRQKRTAIAGLRKELEKDKKLKTVQKKDNETKAVTAAAEASSNTEKREIKSDKLALLNDDADTEKPPPTRSQKATDKTKNETEKIATKPSKIAAAAPKNNGPVAGA